MPAGFFEMVYLVVAGIPRGKVATYGQIARMVGFPRAARHVGFAMRAAPAGRELPCHRVVARTGELAPDAVFGEGVQRRLLEAEGVRFRPDGRIDLDQSLWQPGKTGDS